MFNIFQHFSLILSFLPVALVVRDTDGSAFITKAEFDSLKNNFQSQIDNYNSSIDSKIDGAIASYLSGITLSSTETWNDLYNDLSMNGSTYNSADYGPLKWNASSTSDKNTSNLNTYEVEAHFFQSGYTGGTAGYRPSNITNMYGRYVWNSGYKNKRLVIDDSGKIKSYSDFMPKVTTIITFPVFQAGLCGPLGNMSWNMGGTTWSYNTSIGYIGSISRPSCSVGPLVLYGNSYSYMVSSVCIYTERIIDQSSTFTIRPNCGDTIYRIPESTSTPTTAYNTYTNVRIRNQGGSSGDVILTHQTKLWDGDNCTDMRTDGGYMDQHFIDKMYGCTAAVENEQEVTDWEYKTKETFQLKHGCPLFKALKDATSVQCDFKIEGAGWVYIYESTSRDTWGGNKPTWNDNTKKLTSGTNRIILDNVDKDDVYYFVYLPETGDKGIKVNSVTATLTE